MTDEVKGNEIADPEVSGNGDTPPTQEELETLKQELEEEKKALQAEKSGLGRKIKDMQEAFDMKMNSLETKMMMMGTAEEALPQLTDSDYLTVADYKAIEAQKAKESVENQKKFNQVYLQTIKRELSEISVNDDIASKLLEMTTKQGSPFNTYSHSAPDAAAKINFQKALNNVLTNKTIPGRRDTKLPPAGDPDKTTSKAEPEIVLDAETLEYGKRRGLSEEKMKDLIKKGMPLGA